MRIAIVVPGQFFAFDLAKGLIARGHKVTVFTLQPRWLARRSGLEDRNLRCLGIHGVLCKLLLAMTGTHYPRLAHVVHQPFSAWAAKEIAGSSWDAVFAFSGTAEEILRNENLTHVSRFVIRGSAHIRTQASILMEEEVRTNQRLECPSSWMIDREESEYALADRIIVLSSFAYRSFLEHDIACSKLVLLPLGVDTARFRANAENVEARCARIESGEPLRVIFSGNLTLQKGFFDLIEIARRLRNEAFRFELVGSISAETRALIKELPDNVEIVDRKPQSELPIMYRRADLFVYPSLQDGYGAVLVEALASGLPVLTTTNCAGPDLITEGKNGWVMPIRDPVAFVSRLRWCDTHRNEVASMVRYIHEHFRAREWDEVAAEVADLCHAYPGSR